MLVRLGQLERKSRANWQSPRLTFLNGRKDSIPVESASVDVIICFDVFEHVSQPRAILDECHRILKPGGKMLIGTWGWYYPYAPHLFAVMPVPWAHVFFSERTVMRVCRHVYNAPWYVPNMYDLDENGRKRANKYLEEEISSDFVNKLLLRDYIHAISKSRFNYSVGLQPFSASCARWSRVFLGLPWIREFITSYVWSSLAAA